MVTLEEWNSIYAAIQKEISQSTNFFSQVEVIKVDEERKLIYASEFGDTPIPLVGFRYTASYYNDNGSSVSLKKSTTEPDLPKVGDLVLVARNLGSRRMPRCLGIIFGREYIEQGLGS
jgi:hypothetical protein